MKISKNLQLISCAARYRPGLPDSTVRMGFSEDRIEHRPDGWVGNDPDVVDVNCAICMEVLEDPLMVPDCEHTFCRQCIEGALQNATDDQHCCPQCRSMVPKPHTQHLKPVPRMLRNILGQLKVKCRFAPGCEAPAMSPAVLRTHELSCPKDPNAAQLCTHGCRLLLTNQELADHDCLTAAVAENQRLKSLVIYNFDSKPGAVTYRFLNMSQRPVNMFESTPQFAKYGHAWAIKCRLLENRSFEFSLSCYGPLDR